MEPILFYGVPEGCSFGSIVALEWLRKPYRLCRIQMPEVVSSDDYRRINPVGETPSLLTASGSVISQSMAILHHFAAAGIDRGSASRRAQPSSTGSTKCWRSSTPASSKPSARSGTRSSTAPKGRGRTLCSHSAGRRWRRRMPTSRHGLAIVRGCWESAVVWRMPTSPASRAGPTFTRPSTGATTRACSGSTSDCRTIRRYISRMPSRSSRRPEPPALSRGMSAWLKRLS
jgi:hypothetical protein